MIIRVTFLALVAVAGAGLAGAQTAAPESARIIQYIFDGNKTITRVMIASLGGQIQASVSTSSKKDSQDYMVEIEPEVFEKIWSGFDTIGGLRDSDITDNDDRVDTETHHLFFTQEESAAGSKGRAFALADAKATPEFFAWLKLFLPDPGEARN
jgi:hypothetical protein